MCLRLGTTNKHSRTSGMERAAGEPLLQAAVCHREDGSHAQPNAQAPSLDAAADHRARANADARAALDKWKADNAWWRTAKNKDLPQEFWDLRRRVRNTNRTQRQLANKQHKSAHKRKAELQDPEALTPAEAAQRQAEATAARKQRVAAHLAQQARVELALREGMRIVVDCSFITDCSGREVQQLMRSLAKQLQECVAANKRATQPANLTFTTYTGPLQEFCERMGGERWAANRMEGPTLDSFTASSVVMLSPDAEQPLEALDPAKVYCVGGLVDRSPRKGITAGFAEKHGIEVRRLPIAEQQLKTADGAPVRDKNYILNVNDVVAALLAVHGGSSWAAALDAAVPRRKRLPKDSGAVGDRSSDGGSGGAAAGAEAAASDGTATAADGTAGPAEAERATSADSAKQAVIAAADGLQNGNSDRHVAPVT